jgi:hypothetical protein
MPIAKFHTELENAGGNLLFTESYSRVTTNALKVFTWNLNYFNSAVDSIPW